MSYPTNEAGEIDTNLVRSSIAFITGCLDLRDGTGQVTSNALATRQSDASRRMDFSFNASLYACSSGNNLVRQTASTTPMDPKTFSTCTPLNAQLYSIKMEWLHKHSKIESSATQTVSTFVLRGDPKHNSRSAAEVVDWIAQHKLSKATGTASIAEGEKVDIAMCTTGAEDVSTLKLSDVSMTTSKLPCLLPPYTPSNLVGAGYDACIQTNTLQNQTYSPFVFYATDLALGGIYLRAAPSTPAAPVASLDSGRPQIRIQSQNTDCSTSSYGRRSSTSNYSVYIPQTRHARLRQARSIRHCLPPARCMCTSPHFPRSGPTLRNS